MEKYTEATTENKCYCPNERCSAMIMLDYVDTSETIFQCDDCDTLICMSCKEKFHLGNYLNIVMV